ncbi:MAG: AAA family ATPase [Planctomycetaceae bacterium]|nr:AAA family ATPase [Planctomycetaceae bacterium]
MSIVKGSTEKVPPHDTDSERTILGSILVDPERSIQESRFLNASDFYVLQNQKFFQAIRHLSNERDEINPLTVAEYLEKSGQLHKDEDVPALANLMEYADPQMVNRMSRKVHELRERREAIQQAREIERLAYDPSVSIADLKAEAFELSKGGTDAKERFPSFTAAELDAGDFELEYLIPGFLVKGQPGLYVGPQKTLKTNTAIDLVLSIASGFPFLGDFRVNGKHKAAFVSGESGKATIQETARRIALSKGQPLKNFDGLHFVFNLPSLTSDEDLHHLRHLIEDNGIEFLFLDPLYLMLDGIGDSAGNLFAVGPLLRRLGEMMEELEVTVLLCHHTKNRDRSRMYEPTELEDIAWAGFREFARQWILLSRRSAYDPDSGGHHKLWLNAGGSAGHSNLWGIDITEGRRTDEGGRRWDVHTLTASEAIASTIDQEAEREQEAKQAKQERRDREDRESVLEALKRFPDGEAVSQIATAAKLPNKRATVALMDLHDSKQVEQTEVTRSNNQSYPAWKLATRNQSESVGKLPEFRVAHEHKRHSDSSPLWGVSECVCECEGECECRQSDKNPSGSR